MTIFEFLLNVLGIPSSATLAIVYYIIAGLILMIMVDGIITFLISGITSLTMRGRK